VAKAEIPVKRDTYIDLIKASHSPA
jgi:hypothetical protein